MKLSDYLPKDWIGARVAVHGHFHGIKNAFQYTGVVVDYSRRAKSGSPKSALVKPDSDKAIAKPKYIDADNCEVLGLAGN